MERRVAQAADCAGERPGGKQCIQAALQAGSRNGSQSLKRRHLSTLGVGLLSASVLQVAL